MGGLFDLHSKLLERVVFFCNVCEDLTRITKRRNAPARAEKKVRSS